MAALKMEDGRNRMDYFPRVIGAPAMVAATPLPGNGEYIHTTNANAGQKPGALALTEQ